MTVLAVSIFYCESTASFADPLAATPKGILFLSNGDRLTCELRSYDATAGILSVSAEPLIENPITFSAGGLLRYVRWGVPKAPAAQEWVIELRNGDRIDGSALAIDEKGGRIRHPVVGELRVPRTAIAAVQSARRPSMIYEGPIVGEEWIVNGRPVALLHPTLNLEPPGKSVWARNIGQWPDPFALDFTVRGLSQSQQLMVLIQSDKIAGSGGEITQGYLLALFSNGFVNLLKRTPTNMSVIGNISPRGSRVSSVATVTRFRLYGDKTGKRFILMQGDQKVADWTDPTEPIRGGPYLVFNANGPVVITSIQISRWDGELPDEEKNFPPPDRERIILVNEDIVIGDLETAEASQARVVASFGALSIPLDRIERIEFRGAKVKGDGVGVRVSLEAQTVLRLHLEQIQDGYLMGRHPAAGPVRVPLAAVRRIIWNEQASEGIPDEEAVFVSD